MCGSEERAYGLKNGAAASMRQVNAANAMPDGRSSPAGVSGLQAPFASGASPGYGPQMLPRPYSPFAAPMGVRTPARRESTPQMYNVSEPHTPVNQTAAILANGVEDFGLKQQRFGSVSSIATTDDDENVNEIQYPWTNEQDQLVLSLYDDLISQPDVTPFSSSVPPSGILHRVAKDTLRMAKHKQILFPHSMDAVRHRLIFLCQQNQTDSQSVQKLGQVPDYFMLEPQHLQGDDTLTESGMENPSANSVPDVEEEFHFSNTLPARKQSIEEKYVQISQQNAQQQTLQPAFKEPQPQNLAHFNPKFDLTEEDINVVAKRKRDSLRMKRGPH